MKYDRNIYAEVVFDGTGTVCPVRMGEPKDDQLIGTEMERLVELAGRVCYDSLGKGRSSGAYHSHILEVGHGSVWEHANMTFRVPRFSGDALDMSLLFLNRPGVWVQFEGDDTLRVTMNLRSIVEFNRFTEPSLSEGMRIHAKMLRLALWGATNPFAPQIVSCSREATYATTVTRVDPEHPEEKWVSLLIGGSRGLSHEQVRHKWRVAVSQRSTRYVDESDSSWVEHPLVTEYRDVVEAAFPFDEHGRSTSPPGYVSPGYFENEATGQHYELVDDAQTTYQNAVARLQPWLESRGIDKHTARKQARGAARGFLGNALMTELIFSASVAQWHRMLMQRCSEFADAEIRVLYVEVLKALKTTRWSDDFSCWSLQPAPDGIGEVAVRSNE